MPDAPEEILIRSRRRAPKYRAFVITGAVIGIIAAGILTFAVRLGPAPGAEPYSLQSVFGYTGLFLGLIGGLAGGLLAIAVDRRR